MRKDDSEHELWPAGTLLASLKPDARADLLKISPARRYRAGTVLLRQGDSSSKHAYVVRSVRPRGSASVKITARLPNGAESLLGIRLCGDIIGELAALHGSPRSATVTTCSEVVVHAIQQADLLSFLGRFPEAWGAVNKTIADRLAWANERRLDFAGYPVAARLARVLLALAQRHGHPVEGGLAVGITLSQEEAGKLIGAGRDAVGQAVAKLRRAAVIRWAYRTVVITDVDGLNTFIETKES